MENAQSLIQIYNTGFIVCAGVTAVAFLSAVFMFFKFDIRTIFAIRTGRAERISIKKMEADNARTGTLRPNVEIDYTTDGLGSGGAQTDLLSAAGETTPLAGRGPAPAPAAQPAAPALPPGFKFVVTENQIITHTNEIL